MNISRVVSRITIFRHRYHHSRMFLRIAAHAVLVAVFSAPQLAAAAFTTVRMVTTLGTIDIQLYDDDQAPNQAPITVANFLRYAGRGDYSTKGIIYRSEPGFVIQAGGYAWEDLAQITGFPYIYYFHIPTDPPIQNEFSHSNLRGTIAMAKKYDLAKNEYIPDSATSDWFINLADNGGSPNNLDDIANGGGFTVFGQVLGTGMVDVVDAIASLSILNESGYDPVSGNSVNYPILNKTQPLPNTPFCFTQCNLPLGAFDTLPVNNYDPTTGLKPTNLVMVTDIPNVTATKTFTTGTTSAYAADVDITLSNPNSNTTVDLTTSKSLLATFTPPPSKTVQFNDEISQFKMTWPTGSPTTRVVTLYHGANAGVSDYYAYGPTPNNPTPHWYDFSYDGQTGAEIVGNKILLHFVDGQRGDDDLAANGSVTHTGAPVLVTDIASSSSGGCSIAGTPSPMRSGGEWIMVSMFLAFVALVRKRNRPDRTRPEPSAASE